MVFADGGPRGCVPEWLTQVGSLAPEAAGLPLARL